MGDATEVIEDYKPVTAVEAQSAHSLAGAMFIEAAATPGKYSVRVIRAGLSGNNNYYPDAVLKAGVDKFNGSRVFIKGDVEGWELAVLRGARDTIRRCGDRLALFVELHPSIWPQLGVTRQEVLAEIEAQHLDLEPLTPGDDPWVVEGVAVRLVPRRRA